MSSIVPKLALNNGSYIPMLGLGTWQSEPGQVCNAVKDAIDAGYRHIDSAWAYFNENEVGEAIKAKIDDGTVQRSDVFVTSKLWNTFHSKARVIPSIQDTLKNLDLTYVDLYLIHWPMGYQEGGENMPKTEDGQWIFSDIDYIETWHVLEEAKKQGLVKAIGVSNFNKRQIERILAEGTVKPAMVQVECHPYLNQQKLFDFCKLNEILFTAYSPLGSPNRPWAKPDDPQLMEEPAVLKIAQKHNKTSAQVLIRYQIQRGICCIPKSITKSRIISNFQVFDFVLSEDDMSAIAQLECNGRVLHLSWVSHHPHYAFNDSF